MAANALARAGVSVRIIDQRPAQVAVGQADGIQSRSIEVLQSYGLADRPLREGNQNHAVTFYNPGPTGKIEFTSKAAAFHGDTTRYPFGIALHQGGIEANFLDSMTSMGLRVERPVVPTSLVLSDDSGKLSDPQSHVATVTLEHLTPQGAGETEIVHAKYVLGCDGAHSWVRKTVGIEFEGDQTEDIWGVIDIPDPDTDFPDIRNISMIHASAGSCLLIPREGDSVRLYVQLAERDLVDPATGRIDRSKMGPDEILQIAKQSFYPYRIDRRGGFSWHTLYIIGQRLASKYSVHGRVFIAGDACHTHSPKGGQGMNAGMNDAHNLAWKVAYVLRGWAGLPLLATYEAERRRFALKLIAFDKNWSRLFSGKPRTQGNEDGITHEQFYQAFKQYGLFMTGIGIHYNSSLIVNGIHQTAARNVTIGERMPHVFIRAADFRPFELQDLLPADTRFKIIVFTGDTSDSAQMQKVFALAEDMTKPSGFVSRFNHGRYSGRDTYDFLTISSTNKKDVRWSDFPDLLKSHWSKVFVDDKDLSGHSGGGGYVRYGIGPSGAVVVVRPDGYVGAMAPLDRVDHLTEYFSQFMLDAWIP